MMKLYLRLFNFCCITATNLTNLHLIYSLYQSDESASVKRPLLAAASSCTQCSHHLRGRPLLATLPFITHRSPNCEGALCWPCIRPAPRAHLPQRLSTA